MKRQDLLVLLAILFVLGIVFFQMFTMEQGFLSGDHREQQYPWAKYYQQEIRQHRLPWWTSELQCGFPILAEGQIGAFYPLNYLFFYFLPAKIAYNGIILFQYWLGGVFFYYFLRKIKVSPFAGFWGTLIFLFGSTQGGYFYYNYISQKVVIWLPLTLFLIERLRERKSWEDAFWLALTFAFQIFGGYLQIAVYSIGYTCLYFLWFWLRERNPKVLAFFTGAGLLGIFFSLVQLLPTYELALFSSRANAAKDIAYLGSMTPLGWLTLFYPSWDGFLQSEMYVGILGLFFVFMVFRKEAGSPHRNFFIFAAALFLLLALGKFSPLYIGIIELTGFHSFRTPIKFLFFVSFSLAVLSALGLDVYFKNQSGKILKSEKLYVSLAALMLTIPLIGNWILNYFRPSFINLLQNYVKNHIFGRPGHPYSLEAYMQKAVGFYDSMTKMISWQNKDTLIESFLLLGCIFLLVILRRGKKEGKKLKAALVLFLFIDLFLYGYTSIKPNYEPMKTIDLPASNSPTAEYLTNAPKPYRVMEVYNHPEQNRLFPVFPSMNMMYGIDDAGVYSPLAMKNYRDFVEGWIYVNDSLSIHWADPKTVLEKMDSLSALNIRYLLSEEPLSHPKLKEILREGNSILYENTGVLSRAIFLPGIQNFEIWDPALLSKGVSEQIDYSDPQSFTIKSNNSQPGFLFVSNIGYPNWTATVDGNKEKILSAGGLFQGIQLQPGTHEITFRYDPFLYKQLGGAAFAVALLGLLMISVSAVRRTVWS